MIQWVIGLGIIGLIVNDIIRYDPTRGPKSSDKDQRRVNGRKGGAVSDHSVNPGWNAQEEIHYAEESSFWRHQKRFNRFTVLLTAAAASAAVIAAIFAGRAYDQAKRQADAAIEANHEVQRAFVTVNGVTVEEFHQNFPGIAGDLFWRFIPSIENSGTTPTKNLKWTTNSTANNPKTEFNKLGTDIEARDTISWSYGVLGPKAKMTLDYNAARLELHDRWISQVIAKEVSPSWEGVIRYNDTFPGTKEHVTKFCYVVRVDPGGPRRPYVVQCAKFNCTDDECGKK